MTGKRTILLVVLASAATGALGWKVAATRAPRPAPGVSEDDFAALKTEVQTLARERGRALVQEASAWARAEAPQPAGAPDEARPESVASRAPRARPTPDEARVRAAAQFATYDEHFRAERRDDAWASATERDVGDVIRDPGLAFAKIGEFRCASTLCRLQGVVASEEELEDFASSFGPKTTFLPSGSFRHFDDGHGGVRIEGFFAKPGIRLP